MDVFFNPSDELRSGWKFTGYVVLFLAIWIAMATVLSIFFAASPALDDPLMVLALNAVALAVPAVAAMSIMARVADRKSVAAFGATLHERWARDLAYGLALAGGMLFVLVAFTAGVGILIIGWSGGDDLGRLLATAAVLLVSAANEELIFRGYPLQVLMRGMGQWPAMLFMSILFGLLHASNPNATPLGTLNTMFAGLMLSLAYLQTRSLWFPYGIHTGWNLGLGLILGFPLSGIEIVSLWTSGTRGQELIAGGNYGPEGGLVATALFIGAAIAVRKTRAVGVSPKLRMIFAEDRQEDRLTN